MKLFNALKGEISLLDIKSVIPRLSEEALLYENVCGNELITGQNGG